ncbi:dTDP-4-dehydrorhamnose reductase [Vibrio campbellii]|uniref:dTDP-4-dehydrorhamnose reductase n=1 Tax=Vibrio campbellii TaxID=680 RepID=UPI0005310183|nr:dTDP-4-dehydrorhamnose reductase [Vibrio campbellii]KGR34523.1 dTDP-4-dehydrorhamnose reductase [Vibrio campbellii]
MIKVLVIGSRGQVGTCLVSQLTQRADVELFTFDRQELDITNSNSVISCVESVQPNVIINAAAYTAVDKAEQDSQQCYAVNADAVESLAKAASKVGALMLHISTDYVFDGESDKPYTELDAENPQSVYGKSKLEGEKNVVAFCSRYAVLRTSWVFGEVGNNFVKTMLRLSSTRDEIGVVDDQVGAPTYAGDIASVLITMMDKMLRSDDDLSGIYHYSGTPYVSWFQFAEEIFSNVASQIGSDKKIVVNPIPTHEYPTPAKRPPDTRLDCRKIEKVFSITPSLWQNALKNIKAFQE